MEQKQLQLQLQLQQFTFYDFYAEILNGLKDEEAGRMARRICEYMFDDGIAIMPVDDKERFYWGNLVGVLQEDKTIELSGKIPKGLNRTMRHFTFYENFYGAIKLMDEKQSGQYIKAICGYMFSDETPQLKSPVDGYFTLAKRKLDLSKTRSKVGKKGGNTARVPVSTEQVNATLPFGLKSIGMDGFLRNNPQVKNDVYKNSMHLAEAVDWTYLDEMLPTSLCKLQESISNPYPLQRRNQGVNKEVNGQPNGKQSKDFRKQVKNLQFRPQMSYRKWDTHLSLLPKGQRLKLTGGTKYYKTKNNATGFIQYPIHAVHLEERLDGNTAKKA